MSSTIELPAICLNLKISEETKMPFIITRLPYIGSSKESDNNWLTKNIVDEIFCDSSGNIFKLIDIHVEHKDKNLLRLIGNGFKPLYIYKFIFSNLKEKTELDKFKKHCLEVAKHVFIEEVWETNFKVINEAENHLDLIKEFIIR